MIYLELEDLLYIARRVIGDEVAIRDIGLLEAAAVRPRTSAFGEDAYASIHEKAAALLHSVAKNHALVDGNKRLALASTIAFYGQNGLQLAMSNDEAYDLVIAVVSGELDEVAQVARVLEVGTEPRARTDE